MARHSLGRWILMALTVAALTGLAARQVVRLASQPDGTRLAGVN